MKYENQGVFVVVHGEGHEVDGREGSVEDEEHKVAYHMAFEVEVVEAEVVRT